MINIVNKENCSGCHACYNACPKHCISMIADNEGFLYPQVNEEGCIKCGICVKTCPIITPQRKAKSEADIKAYGAYNKNEKIRKCSSSGGIFTLIAEWVINNGGVVFGAAFNDDFSVAHRAVSNVEGLAQLRGSKYVQSTIGDTYKQAEELLKTGKMVLFTGTPCQIGGLYSYLKRDYDNLITQDIVCHGVPSRKIWEGYRAYHETKEKSKIQKVSFRNKERSWKSYQMAIDFQNGKKYRQISSGDSYLKSFVSNLCLRPSCYACAFKDKVRESDITLADFWGIQNVMPEMDDDKGTSLVLINSEKGQIVFDSIKESIVSREADINEALKYNSSAIQSVKMPDERNDFIKKVDEQGFDVAAKCYIKKDSISLRLKRKIKSIMRKLIK